MRRIFLGDIQGCSDQLDRLLHALRISPADRIYCVGDLVNRGPDSLGVLRRIRALGAKVVLGNHDLQLLRAAAGTVSLRPGHPLAAVLSAPDAGVLLAWLESHPVLLVEEDVAVVHAGLHPEWRRLETVAAALNSSVRKHVAAAPDAGVTFATSVRYCDAHGRTPAADDPPPGPPFQPWDRFYRGTRTVVFGHWSRRGLVSGPRLRGLDTGCVWGGKLTAWIAEENRFVHVPGWTGRSG